MSTILLLPHNGLLVRAPDDASGWAATYAGLAVPAILTGETGDTVGRARARGVTGGRGGAGTAAARLIELQTARYGLKRTEQLPFAGPIRAGHHDYPPARGPSAGGWQLSARNME